MAERLFWGCTALGNGEGVPGEWGEQEGSTQALKAHLPPAQPWASQSTTAPAPRATLRPLLGGDTEPPLGEGSNTEHIMRPKAALSPQLYP